jgi:hypothetical protein
MRTLRLSLAGTLILALLGGLSVAVVAQSEEASTPTVVTGNEVCTVVQNATVIENTAEVVRDRGQVTECETATSDPRVSGTYTNVANWDFYWALDEAFLWGTTVLEGPTGGWDCSYAGTSDPTGANDGLVFLVCPGTGEYDGLTYVYQHVWDSGTADFGDGTDVFGLIFEGPSPVTLEAVEVPAE